MEHKQPSEDPRTYLQFALDHLRSALELTPKTLLAAREIEEAIDHAELAISDLDDGGTVEDVDDEEDGPRPCPDCGGFGHGPDTMQGGEHHTGPCPTCNGSGLATPFEDCGPTPRAKIPEECNDEKCPNEAPGETCSRCGATVADVEG